MAVKPIVQHPNKYLRKISTEVKDFKDANNLAKDLSDTLESSKIPGVGLSAPQIGVNLRMFVVRKFIETLKGESFVEYTVINPKVVNKSSKKDRSLEACLSIGDTFGYVNRNRQITIEYTDLNGNKQTLSGSKLLSYAIQHEIDHLDGVLFIDKTVDKKTYTEKQIGKILPGD